MTTNRIQYIDQNESSYLAGGHTPIVGYTVVKAPRGVTEPIKFERGDEQKIWAMLGRPTKSYPDIQEAIEFNRSYSLYVSAPPGTRENYANYYGGVYTTTEASFELFHEVTDPTNPNFRIVVNAGSSGTPFNKSFAGVTAPITFTPSSSGVNGSINVGDINSLYLNPAKITKMTLSYPTPDINANPYEVSESGAISTLEMTVNGTDIEVAGEVVGAFVVDEVSGNTTFKLNAMPVGPTSPDMLEFTYTNGALDSANEKLNAYLALGGVTSAINISWVINIQDFVIQTFYQNSPRQNETIFTFGAVDLDPKVMDGVIPSVPEEDNPYYNTITFLFEEYDSAGNVEYTSSNIKVSPDILAKDGNGASLFYADVMSGKTLWYIGSQVYKQYSDTSVGKEWDGGTETAFGERVMLSSGISEVAVKASLAEGWSAAGDPLYEEVNIFFDNTGETDVKTTMSSLRNTVHKTARFVSPVYSALSDTTLAVAALVSVPVPRNKGLSYHCNEFLLKDTEGKEYWSFITGTVASNLALIMDMKLGGAAPMFLNDGDGLGGQLSRSVSRAKYKFTADQLDTLDAAGLNPIVKSPFEGLMLTSQKTGASPAVLTDWSFLGHAMAFDLLKREIKNLVMVPQIGKAINPYYLSLRQDQTQIIVNKRLTGATAIWAGAVVMVNDVTVNNDDTKMQNKFVVKVRVKVNPFTEYVDFVLNNVDQKTEL